MIEARQQFKLGSTLLYAIALCLSLSVAVCAFGAASVLAPSAALADDDDDDDDDSDGGRGGGGGGGFGGGGGGGYSGGNDGVWNRSGSGGGNIFDLFRKRETRTPRRVQRRARPQRVRRSRPPRATRPAQTRPAVPLPTRANAEIIALGLAEAQLDPLLAAGYTILQQAEIDAIDATLLRLSVPAGTSLEDARAAVRAIDPDAVADFNHFYRPVEREADEPCRSLSCGAAQQIAWPVHPGTRSQCAAGATIGMVDTGINAQHEALIDADLTVLRFEVAERNARGSSARHGTAVAAILLSSDRSRAPGLVPDAKVYAVDAFFRAVAAGNVVDERTDAFTLVRAMDLVAAQPITVLNLSLAGPANTTVESMVEALSQEAIVIVASAGNAGPGAEPMYPAAYPEVIGVTAVDHTNRIFRRATRGDHVDFAAPGVEVWTAASVRGVKPRTGTSFATPFVTAVVAMLQSQDRSLSLEELRKRLASDAQDLGESGRDPIYGFGLVQAPAACVVRDALSDNSNGVELTEPITIKQ